VSDEIRQVEPEDHEITEEWERLTSEPEIRGVSACLPGGRDGWVVSIWAQEFYREQPLGLELRQRVQSALRAVAGVTGVGEHDNESWGVSGNPSGEALVRAATGVVDELADRLREGAF
jgi:hypothetical protein